MIHPATAHFAMVLPVVASVFGIAYLVSKTTQMSKIYSRVTLFAAIAMGVVWFTGGKAGPEIYNYLSDAGQATLVAHKTLGLYLAIAMALIAIVQIAGCKMQKKALEISSVVALLVVTATTFYQGKLGGEIVYNHGTPFKAYTIMDTLAETLEAVEEEESDEAKLEVLTDAIDDINMHSEEIDLYYGIIVQEKEEE